MNIENVAILGGNGNVGSLVGGIIASFGHANVYLVVRNKENTESLIDKICKSVRADSIRTRLNIIDYEEAKQILKKCDWIFESIAEEYNMKVEVFEFINKYSKEDAIITTGTSGLSINKLSYNLSECKRKNFFGTHFFNPPYNMNLCEIIACEATNIKCIENFKQYLEKQLLRKVIISKDKPAFIANRIGFKFLNNALVYCEKYKEKGGIDYIDYLFQGYTGRAMQPLVTLDFVGLDIHKAIIDNIQENTIDIFKQEFILPTFAEKLIEQRMLGKKSGAGLYKTIDGIKNVFDINKKQYRKIKQYKNIQKEQIVELIKEGEYEKAYKKLVESDDEDMEIVLKMLINYIVYAYIIGKETATKLSECDDAMANGFGWCPPFALKDLFDKTTNFSTLCEKYIEKEILAKYDIIDNIKKIPISQYDYRKYIRAI